MNSQIQKNLEKITALLNKNIDLQYKEQLKGAKRFTEKIVNLGTRKKPRMCNVKFMHWYEWFKDKDYPEKRGIRIERYQGVEVNGQRSFGYRILEYYTVDEVKQMLYGA